MRNKKKRQRRADADMLLIIKLSLGFYNAFRVSLFYNTMNEI